MRLFVFLLCTSLIVQIHGQQFCVSASRENKLYLGVDNPIEVVVENTSCDSIIVVSNNGQFTYSNNCRYILKPINTGIALISIYKINNNDTISLGSAKFRVKEIPTPTAHIYGSINGKISKTKLVAANRIFAYLESFDIDLRFPIIKYTTLILRNKKSIYYNEFEGGRFPSELSEYFLTLLPGDRVFFFDIVATGPYEKLYNLKPVGVTIE